MDTGGAVPKSGLVWVLFANVVVGIDYSILMPTAFEYFETMGASWLIYSLAIAAYPVGRTLLLLPVGNWSATHGFRCPFMLGCALSIVGGMVYACASSNGSAWYAILGRFLSGCGASYPLSAWAARAYPPEKRSRIEGLTKGAQLIGVVFGPALNAFAVNLDTDLGWIKLNPRTFAGILPAALNLLLLSGFFGNLDEPGPIITKTQTRASSNSCAPLMSSGAWIFLLIVFHINFQIAAVDTILAPLTSRNLNFGLLSNSALFAAVAVVCFFGVIAGIVAHRGGVSFQHVIFAGSILNAVGAILVTCSFAHGIESVQMWIFIAGGAIVNFSNLFYVGSTGALYMNACVDETGFLGRVYSVFFSLGRPFGSILGGVLLQSSPWPLTVIMCVGLLASIILQWTMWSSLMKIEHADDCVVLVRTRSIPHLIFPDAPAFVDNQHAKDPSDKLGTSLQSTSR